MWKLTNRTCGRTARSLGEYLDGTLPLPRRRKLEAHLRGCAACRREMEATRRTLALLADLPRRELSDDFDLALRARLSEPEGSRGSGEGRRWWSFLIPAANTSHAASHCLRAPWPSPARRLAPAGALAALALGLVAWQLQPSVHTAPDPKPTPAYVSMVVREHQMIATGSDLNSTVVSHNLGGGVLGDSDDDSVTD